MYLPPDANTLLVVTDICLRSRNCVNVVVAGSICDCEFCSVTVIIDNITSSTSKASNRHRSTSTWTRRSSTSRKALASSGGLRTTATASLTVPVLCCVFADVSLKLYNAACGSCDGVRGRRADVGDVGRRQGPARRERERERRRLFWLADKIVGRCFDCAFFVAVAARILPVAQGSRRQRRQSHEAPGTTTQYYYYEFRSNRSHSDWRTTLCSRLASIHMRRRTRSLTWCLARRRPSSSVRRMESSFFFYSSCVE